MSMPAATELADFEAQCDAWFREHTVADPGFMLPLTFMEVSTDQQFDFLQSWQRQVYEAGYIGIPCEELMKVKQFINKPDACARITEAGVMWQTIIHMTFIASAIGIAYTDLLMQRVSSANKAGH